MCVFMINLTASEVGLLPSPGPIRQRQAETNG